MSSKPLEVRKDFHGDQIAEYIANTWHTYNTQRQEKIDEWMELQRYVFATDTTTTTNSTLPWKNSTTLPKLCQIRDNLHSNYVSALFPNDDWLQWQGYTLDDSLKEKAAIIEAYMSNKTRISGFRNTVSKLLYDYLDYGCAISVPDFI